MDAEILSGSSCFFAAVAETMADSSAETAMYADATTSGSSCYSFAAAVATMAATAASNANCH